MAEPTAPPPPPSEAHPRDVVIEAAVRDLLPSLRDWAGRHGLTAVEYAHILCVLLGRQVQQMCLHERDAATPAPEG